MCSSVIRTYYISPSGSPAGVRPEEQERRDGHHVKTSPAALKSTCLVRGNVGAMLMLMNQDERTCFRAMMRTTCVPIKGAGRAARRAGGKKQGGGHIRERERGVSTRGSQ